MVLKTQTFVSKICPIWPIYQTTGGAQGQLLPLAVLDGQVDVDAFATGANATERCSSARCAFCRRARGARAGDTA